MRNYKDMADAVFARRDEYVASVNRKKKIALNTSLSLCSICLAVLGAFGIWKTGVLTPDPNVIGTKPQSLTEPATETHYIVGSNATSEGKSTEATELISGNTKPQNNSETTSTPARDSKPTATDPVEKPTLPAIGPGVPSVKPTLPIVKPTIPVVKPTLPVVTEPVEEPTQKPQKPQPSTPVAVVPDVTGATSGEDSAGSDEAPEPTTAQPTTEPNFAAPDEPPYTEPCCTYPSVDTDIPCAPETQAPTVEDVPPTSVDVNRVEGKVVDQYGNPVKGAVVKVYRNGSVVATYTTGSRGYFYMAKFPAPATVEVYSVPSGYTLSGLSENILKGYNYIILTCNKN